MYHINGFVFDPVRLLLFRHAASEREILNYDCGISAQPLDLQLNPSKMNMNTFALNNAGICLSYNCNLRCQYCGYSSEEGDAGALKLEDVQVFIRDIVRRRAIKKLITTKDEPLEIELTGGGEPTYNWTLFRESIKFIKNLCEDNKIPLRLRLTTNGMLSTEQTDFISSNIDHVMISYDGLPDIQNRNRFSPYEKNSCERVEQTIRKLSASGISITIRSTIWADDFDKMMDMYTHTSALVAPRTDAIWSIYPVLFEGRATKRIQHQKATVYKHFFAECLKLMQNKIHQESRDGLLIDFSIFNTDACSFFCGAHRALKPWLLPDKSIATCIESKDDKTFIGKIGDGSVHYFTNYQDPLLKIAQTKYYECQGCIAYGTCKGGCPIWHLRVDEEIQEPLECSLQKEYWSYLLDALTTGGYSMGWKLERISPLETNDFDCFKVVRSK